MKNEKSKSSRFKNNLKCIVLFVIISQVLMIRDARNLLIVIGRFQSSLENCS